MKQEYRDELRECFKEISEINNFVINNVGDSKNKYLQLYLVMRCCGAVEHIFKHLVFDKITFQQDQRIVSYFENVVLRNPVNPSYGNICEVIGRIDSSWSNCFKSKFSKNDGHLQRLDSFVKNRHRFAHGVSTTIPSINETKDNLISACFVLSRLEQSLI